MGYPKGSHSGSHMGSIEYSPKWKKKIARINKFLIKCFKTDLKAVYFFIQYLTLLN